MPANGCARNFVEMDSDDYDGNQSRGYSKLGPHKMSAVAKHQRHH